MDQETLEKMAKKVADLIAGHDVSDDQFRFAGYHKHNGEIFMRLCQRNREKAFKNLDNHMSYITFTDFTLDPADRENFYDHVLAELCGGGYEVEWEEPAEAA